MSFCGWLGELSPGLRVCCEYTLLGVPPITRKSILFLDFIPENVVDGHYLRRRASNHSPYLRRRKLLNQSILNNSGYSMITREICEIDDDAIVIDLFCEDEEYFNQSCAGSSLFPLSLSFFVLPLFSYAVTKIIF